MRELRQRSIFKGDLKRECRGRYRAILTKGGDFHRTVEMLRHDMHLPLSYKDHALHGKWEGSRKCHIRPDLLLVYTLEGDDVLILERLGSHSVIFGL